MPQSQELKPTVFRDVVSAITEADSTLADIARIAKVSGKEISELIDDPYRGSIARRASDLVLVFPVIVTTSIDIKTAIMISKAIERKCVSLLQILFSSMNMSEFKDIKTLQDYIKRFHTNIDMSAIGPNMSLDEFITFMNRAGKGSPYIRTDGKNESVVTDPETFNRVLRELKEISVAARDFINETAVSDYKIKYNSYNQPVVSKSANSWAEKVQLEVGGAVRQLINRGHGPDTNNAAQNDSKDKSKDSKDKSEGRPRPDIGYPYTKDVAGFFDKQIVSSDVTKANELAPTMMVVNFISVTGAGTPVNRAGIVGIKAKLYPMESTEILGRLSTKVSDSNTLFSIIQASTKEKSFWKDLVFSFDKLKRDAINLAKGSVNAKIFNLLERRANKNSSRFSSGGANPITTLVISQEEVEYLKKYSNINLENPSVLNIVMQGYNLMGIVIVDDSTEIARFLYDDGGGVFETLTYKALEKDDSDANYKKIVNLMSKVAR